MIAGACVYIETCFLSFTIFNVKPIKEVNLFMILPFSAGDLVALVKQGLIFTHEIPGSCSLAGRIWLKQAYYC